MCLTDKIRVLGRLLRVGGSLSAPGCEFTWMSQQCILSVSKQKHTRLCIDQLTKVWWREARRTLTL